MQPILQTGWIALSLCVGGVLGDPAVAHPPHFSQNPGDLCEFMGGCGPSTPSIPKCPLHNAHWKVLNPWKRGDKELTRPLCRPRLMDEDPATWPIGTESGPDEEFSGLQRRQLKADAVTLPAILKGTTTMKSIVLPTRGIMSGSNLNARYVESDAPTITGNFEFVYPNIYLVMSTPGVDGQSTHIVTSIVPTATPSQKSPLPSSIYQRQLGSNWTPFGSGLKDDFGWNEEEMPEKIWGTKRCIHPSLEWPFIIGPRLESVSLLNGTKLNSMSGNVTRGLKVEWGTESDPHFAYLSATSLVSSPAWTKAGFTGPSATFEGGELTPRQYWDLAMQMTDWWDGDEATYGQAPGIEVRYKNCTAEGLKEHGSTGFDVAVCTCEQPTARKIVELSVENLSCSVSRFRWSYDTIDQASVRSAIKAAIPGTEGCNMDHGDFDDVDGEELLVHDKIPRILQLADETVSPMNLPAPVFLSSSDKIMPENSIDAKQSGGPAPNSAQELHMSMSVYPADSPQSDGKDEHASKLPEENRGGKPNPKPQFNRVERPQAEKPQAAINLDVINAEPQTAVAYIALESGLATIIRDRDTGSNTILQAGASTVFSGTKATFGGHVFKISETQLSPGQTEAVVLLDDGLQVFTLQAPVTSSGSHIYSAHIEGDLEKSLPSTETSLAFGNMASITQESTLDSTTGSPATPTTTTASIGIRLPTASIWTLGYGTVVFLSVISIL